MQVLNLPVYPLKIKNIKQNKYIFDIIRKKFIVLTPEEWVRQNFVHYLIHEKQYPAGLLSVEMFLKVNKLSKRADLVVFSNNAKPIMIIECKAPEVKINQKAFDQIWSYNIALNVKYLIVTNGMQSFCCKATNDMKSYFFLKNIPNYAQLIFD